MIAVHFFPTFIAFDYASVTAFSVEFLAFFEEGPVQRLCLIETRSKKSKGKIKSGTLQITNYNLQTFNSDIIIDIKIINYNIPSISFAYYAGYTLARHEL
jgi:hypothetical protein